jgi:transketolase
MERIIDLSYKHSLGHIGSCLTALPILEHIYSTKKENDIVVLSAGHAGVALYSVLEKYEGHNAEELLDKHGVHPCRDLTHGIHVSTGSLGSGILVAVGYALADRLRDVHVVISDGECAEGSVWEALAFVYKENLTNLKIHVNVNGYSAYDAVNTFHLWLRLKVFYWRTRVWFTKPPSVSFLRGLQGHYHVMKGEDKDEITSYINAQGVCSSPSRGYAERLSDLFDYGRSWVWNSRSNS